MGEVGKGGQNKISPGDVTYKVVTIINKYI